MKALTKEERMEITSNNQIHTSGLQSKKESNETQNNSGSSFQDTLIRNSEDKKTEENEIIKNERTSEELLADIISLMKTGLTVGEVQALQELLKELKEEIKTGNYDEKEIEKLLSDVEKAIVYLQKKITGEAIIESDKNNLKDKTTNETDSISEGFLIRIDEALNKLESLASGKEKKEKIGTSPNESELLVLINEFQK
jgi:hypothetical protein